MKKQQKDLRVKTISEVRKLTSDYQENGIQLGAISFHPATVSFLTKEIERGIWNKNIRSLADAKMVFNVVIAASLHHKNGRDNLNKSDLLVGWRELNDRFAGNGPRGPIHAFCREIILEKVQNPTMKPYQEPIIL